jgi:hypothetical protein
MQPFVSAIPSGEQLRVLAGTGAMSAQQWQIALQGVESTGVEVLKQTHKVAVVRTTLLLGGSRHLVVLKTEPVRGGWNWFRLVTGTTRLHRHWHNAARLTASDTFPTAGCLALLGWKTPGGERMLTLVMDAVDGPTLLEVMAQTRTRTGLTTRTQHQLAHAVGERTRAMLDAHLTNRDHKPSNIVVTGLDPVRLDLIDLVGVKPAGARGVDLVQPATSLVLEPLGCGVLPRASLRMRALCALEPDRDRRKRLWRAVEARVQAHGDPTPRDNPLLADPEIDTP